MIFKSEKKQRRKILNAVLYDIINIGLLHIIYNARSCNVKDTLDEVETLILEEVWDPMNPKMMKLWK